MALHIKPAVAAPLLAAVVVFSGLVIAASLSACESRTAAPSPVTGKRAPDKLYTTRGRITTLPVPGKAMTELRIQHEPIDDFENPDGSRGMSSMEMPFVSTPDVSLSGLAPKDIVEFDLAVWYMPGKKSIESYRLTRMKKLPADTALRSGAATPTLGSAPESPAADHKP